MRHTPSKKDLHKQKKLTKRVSDLEHKLASARKELQSVLQSNDDHLPPVPPLPATLLPPTPPVTSQSDSADMEVDAPISSPSRTHQQSNGTNGDRSSALPRKITKKRKAASPNDSDADYKPIPTDSEGDLDILSLSDNALSERELEKRTVKRMKSNSGANRKALKKSKNGEKLQKRSRKSLGGTGKKRTEDGGGDEMELEQDRPVTVVPDGVRVPFVPELPGAIVSLEKEVRLKMEMEMESEPHQHQHQQQGDEAKKSITMNRGDASVNNDDDGYGGLGHEIF